VTAATQRLDGRDVERAFAERAGNQRQLVVLPGVCDGDLGGRHRITREGDRRRPLEQRLERLELGAVKRALRQFVLGDAEIGAGGAHLAAQIGDFLDRHAGLVGDDHDRRLGERGVQRIDQLLLLGPVHGTPPTK